MQLTKLEVRALQLAWRLRTERSILPTLIRASVRTWLLLILIYSFLILAFWCANLPELASGAAGVMVGAMARDFAHLRQRDRVWSLTREITHWKRVAKLLHHSGSPVDNPLLE